jgi:hypothetical protein
MASLRGDMSIFDPEKTINDAVGSAGDKLQQVGAALITQATSQISDVAQSAIKSAASESRVDLDQVKAMLDEVVDRAISQIDAAVIKWEDHFFDRIGGGPLAALFPKPPVV